MKPTDRNHPADERLIALYFGDTEQADEGEPSVRQHVHGCETCTWRYAELTAPLERLRTDAASEADEIFTASRLDAQRVAIRERLENGARASRVILFPAGRPTLDRTVISRPMFRWVAAAAAAGLLVGVSAGRFIHLDGLGDFSRPTATQAVRVPAPAPAPAVLPENSSADEAFLSEVETAVSQHRIAALSALDDLTPHAREAVMMARAR